MPIAPLQLNRTEPTLGNLFVLIDKELINSVKRTLESAPFLSVDAPWGSRKFSKVITTAYEAMGWFKVTYMEGYSIEQDRIRFFGYDRNPAVLVVAPTLQFMVPHITSNTSATLQTGETVMFYGTNLQAVVGVKIAGVPAPILSATPGELAVQVPQPLVGGGSSIFIEYQTSATTNSFFYTNDTVLVYVAPSFISVQPQTFYAGQTVIITGSRLDLVTGILLGNSRADSLSIQTMERLTFVVPVISFGTHLLKMTQTNGYGAVATVYVEVIPAPLR